MPEVNRFWVLDFDLLYHYADLVTSAKGGDLVCIVDEEAGGIIGYMSGISSSAVIRALNDAFPSPREDRK